MTKNLRVIVSGHSGQRCTPRRPPVMGEPTWWYGSAGSHSSSSSRWLQAQMVPPLRSRRRSPRCGRGLCEQRPRPSGARPSGCKGLWAHGAQPAGGPGRTGEQFLNAGSPRQLKRSVAIRVERLCLNESLGDKSVDVPASETIHRALVMDL